MIDFSLKAGICHEFLGNLFGDSKKYKPEIIRNYPFFNYLLRSGTPNNYKYGKLGILLVIFLGIIKKFDNSLVRYYDAFFYKILRELDYTKDGLTIPGMELNAFKSFLKIISDLTYNTDIRILRDNLCIVPDIGDGNSEAEAIVDDIEMLLCHVIIRYNVEQIMGRLSAISRINIHEINKILLVKYFPRTFLLLGNFEAVPSEFLINSPWQMHQYMKTLGKVKKDEDVVRILTLELKIFETKFFVNKRLHGYGNLDSIRELVNNKSSSNVVRVNDTISILHNYYESDVDLERWTGSSSRERDEVIDVIVYYNYISGKVRHQPLSEQMKDIISFFNCGVRSKSKYLQIHQNNVRVESLLNEMIYKGILL